MINPAIRLIILLFFVKNPITLLDHCAEINVSVNNEIAIPIPKNMKLNKFAINDKVEVLMANKTISDAGLHGRIIAPKKKPNPKELKKGFLAFGVTILGKNLVKLKLKIKNKLTIARIPKAIGDTIPITFVNETCKNFVKINPNKNIETITPKATIKPNKIIVFFGDFFDT